MQVLGKIAVVLLIVAVLALGQRGHTAPEAAPGERVSAGAGLLVFPLAVNDQVQLVYVVEPVARVLAVYRLEVRSGKLKLEAVRQLKWDLELAHYDNDKPLPEEVRKMIEAPR